jgi:aminoglycoside N3'-acetyltransferase
MYQLDASRQGQTMPPDEVPAWTCDQLREHLADRCGVGPGDILILHCSLKAIGRVEGGPETLVRALQAALTDGGTLLAPTFTQPQPDGVFHLDATPSRTGLVTETFRKMPGVRRSRHPTHSVSAWGRRAEEFVEGHDRTSGLGVGSPFHKAALAGADVLMIGCSLTACSLVHVTEAACRVPYLGKVWYPGYDRTLTLVDSSGKRTEVPPRDPPTDSAGFVVVQEELERRGALERCRLGAADGLKFSGRACLDVATELLRRDPAALLCHNPRCPVCPAAREIIRRSAAAPGG